MDMGSCEFVEDEDESKTETDKIKRESQMGIYRK